MVSLSKSKILLNRQCPRRLWLQTYKPELSNEDHSALARFRDGNAVGDIARKLHPNGIFIETLNKDRALQETADALQGKPVPIFEAAFMAVAHELATDLKRPEIKKKYVGIERPFPAKQLCQALCDHNYKIAHFFFSDSGVVLQNLDSKMADLIIQDFISDDEVLLPYHDSFIVKKSLEEKLETSMNKAYTYVVGSNMNCKIDKKY